MAESDYPEPLDVHVRRIVSQFDTNHRREAFEERAAIVQYDGHVGRAQAERLAGRPIDPLDPRYLGDD